MCDQQDVCEQCSSLGPRLTQVRIKHCQQQLHVHVWLVVCVALLIVLLIRHVCTRCSRLRVVLQSHVTPDTSVSQLRAAIQAAVSGVPPPGSSSAVVGTPHISTDTTGVHVNAMGGSITLIANGGTATVADILSALDSLRSV